MVVTDPVTHEEEEDRSDQWGLPISVSGKEERRGRATERAAGEAGPPAGPMWRSGTHARKKQAVQELGQQAEINGEKKILSLFLF